MSLLNSREDDEAIIVHFTETKILDETKIQEIGKGLLDFCKQASEAKKKLKIDFQGVQFMSSAMIGKLVLLNKFAKQTTVDLTLHNLSNNVLEVFKITRLNKVFRIVHDTDDPGAASPAPAA